MVDKMLFVEYAFNGVYLAQLLLVIGLIVVHSQIQVLHFVQKTKFTNSLLNNLNNFHQVVERTVPLY